MPIFRADVFKDGAEPDSRASEVLDVIQVPGDPLDLAAHELFEIVRGRRPDVAVHAGGGLADFVVRKSVDEQKVD